MGGARAQHLDPGQAHAAARVGARPPAPRRGAPVDRLDTERRVEAPEGVAVALRVAGPFPRLGAWLIDQGIRLSVYSTIGGVLGLLGSFGEGIMSILIFVVEWFYPVVFELRTGGRTPGKMAIGLMVVQADGTPITPGAALLRNLLRFADFLPFAYLGGLLCMLSNADFARVGDLAAGTVVVWRDRPAPSARPSTAAPEPPPLPLLLHEQRAIMDFADRQAGWSEARQLELAGHLEPLLGGPPPTTLRRLLGVAAWLRGGGR
jgi:uncharacterized RDD family membrane protein YckC